MGVLCELELPETTATVPMAPRATRPVSVGVSDCHQCFLGTGLVCGVPPLDWPCPGGGLFCAAARTGERVMEDAATTATILPLSRNEPEPDVESSDTLDLDM